MPFLESALIELGGAIAKAIFKLWVKDSSFYEDTSSSLIDLIKTRTLDIRAQRKGERQFAEIGDKISESLSALFEYEGTSLGEGERAAVALAIAETFNKSKFSAPLILQYNLEPTLLTRYLLAANPNVMQTFSEKGTMLYQRIIQESCVYIVDIASDLPAFTEQSFAEILKRESHIISATEKILEQVRSIRTHLDPMAQSGHFEIEYRQAMARNLDILQLVGADISLPNRRHRLSVAYITLSVSRKKYEGQTKQQEREVVPVDVALASSRRLLILGVSGSGKTTLLQWIAVRAATRSFEGKLADWNTYIPFYVRLRRCIQSGFPRPEDFPSLVAPFIADSMPKGWVHTVLQSGNALVLIDGVDELSTSLREDAHTWLNDLVETYPKARYIVTSRPHAIQIGWMRRATFSLIEFMPMALANIPAFIDHWHDAVREELSTDEERDELQSLASHIKIEIRSSSSLKTLATNPLLCALLCALNRDRRQQLPANRIELYKACCSLLLERRDKESRVDLADYPSLNIRQKERLLQALAYRMIQDNLSEAKTSFVDVYFDSKLIHMNVEGATGSMVRKLFVERTGIIRETSENKIDFAHRTFEEFFAAQEALDTMDIEGLLAIAKDSQWVEVVVLVTGLAPKATCQRILDDLVQPYTKRNYPIDPNGIQAAYIIRESQKIAVEYHLSQKAKWWADRMSSLPPPADY